MSRNGPLLEGPSYFFFFSLTLLLNLILEHFQLLPFYFLPKLNTRVRYEGAVRLQLKRADDQRCLMFSTPPPHFL